MAFELDVFSDAGLDESLLSVLVGEHERDVEPKLRRLWSYYRNELIGASGMIEGDGRWYRQGQASGLPARIRRLSEGGGGETVIENDIGWRIDSLVDFVFGRPVKIVSVAGDEATRRRIEETLDAVFEQSGGARLFQDMALLGSVYGHVDLVVRLEELFQNTAVRDVARRVRVELIEPTRGIPVLDPGDFRRMEAYVIRSRVTTNDVAHGASGGGLLARVLGRRGGGRRVAEVVEIISATHRQVYVDGALVEDGVLRFGVLPIVHAQNTGQPFRYEGISDVEPMIPLQDELNARLSDRAHRVTLQSFKMYLARGIEGFGDVAVGPGQVWTTDNPDAGVEAFGGDASSPSEDAHIAEVREALDKVSGVSPLVLGVVRAKVGHLSSENALRIALMGVLSKTMRKRQSYGGAILKAGRMILDALDASGVMETAEEDRGLLLRWPDPIPVDERDRLREAELKRALGVPAEVVLAELGYGTGDGGVS